MTPAKNVLITGGAGFIGSFVCEKLVASGCRVTLLDRLDSQVHGNTLPQVPRGVRLIRGEVGDRTLLARVLPGIDSIVHLAAAVGVGQSMYEIEKYVRLNTYQTAIFMETLIRQRKKIRKLVVASSMSIYGEGAYKTKSGRPVTIQDRPIEQLRRHQWEARNPDNPREILHPIPTPETISLRPTSIYAITKRDQEEICLTLGKSYGIPTVALRFFNVYGPRQALSNPYTGVAAIFSSRLLNGNPPHIYEDGLQSRDFIHVSDIAQACFMALTKSGGDYLPMNVGTGRSLTVKDVASILATKLGSRSKYVLENKFRAGDIRHCFADISRIKKALGFRPRVKFENGIEDLVGWVKQQKALDCTQKAASELQNQGLIW